MIHVIKLWPKQFLGSTVKYISYILHITITGLLYPYDLVVSSNHHSLSIAPHKVMAKCNYIGEMSCCDRVNPLTERQVVEAQYLSLSVSFSFSLSVTFSLSLCISLSVYPFVIICPSNYLSTYLSMYLSISLSNQFSISLPIAHDLSTYLSVLSICLSVYLSSGLCLSLNPSIHRGVHVFDIWTSDSGTNTRCFSYLSFQMRFALQRSELFQPSHLPEVFRVWCACTSWLPNVHRSTNGVHFLNEWQKCSEPAVF